MKKRLERHTINLKDKILAFELTLSKYIDTRYTWQPFRVHKDRLPGIKWENERPREQH